MTDSTKWAKRDNLVENELLIQKSWEQNQIFNGKPDSNKPKFFGTFPYCYQNGTMHLGHAYTLSKLEYMARFKRLNGYNVLFPIGFHGTGVPIVACANRLKEALELYDLSKTDIIESIPKGNQIRILYEMGIPLDEMSKFIDPYYWLKHFPQRAKEDLKRFGAAVDLTRCFITTDMNPYYDSFIKWQFNILNSKGYLKVGEKPIIYSPKDKQACGDHDRKTGEGVNPKKFTAYLCPISHLTDLDFDSKYPNLHICITLDDKELESIRNISANDIKIFAIINELNQFQIIRYGNRTFIACSEFIRNFKYQILNQEDQFVIEPINITGNDLIDSKFILDEKIHEINIQKSTSSNAIQGSGIKIIAKSTKQDINNDSKNNESKNNTKLDLSKHISFIYYEPEKEIISRSDDRCVVALLSDQWFLNYGGAELKNNINSHIDNKMNIFNKTAKDMLRGTSDWLNEWPCSRSSGLGTKLLDTNYVIDSLSDSTIYMAYYTIANRIEQIPMEYVNNNLWNYLFLNTGNAEQLQEGAYPDQYLNIIEEMRSEFKYWYPVNLRVSGKDLIGNHLTMALYNH